VPRTVIGLDIGTSAVRAAEVRFTRGRASLVRFGQVALDPGAVVGGEVVDAMAVGAALKRLWRDAGFKSKRVVTGIAGQRVVARTTELPMLHDDELRSSLPFHVQELIPIPIDEAVIDHQILETTTAIADDGLVEERLRVLVVAAHRDVLRSLLAALEVAGLEPERVDLIPFALIRSLHGRDFAELTDANAGAATEAIVDIGGGITNVVVHEHGVPRFLRSLGTGGVEVTEALVTDLDVDFGQAEALKRSAAGGDGGGSTDVTVQQARDVYQAALAPVLEEIRASLEFWETQSPDQAMSRIVVTGGGGRSPEVLNRLERLVGIPVVGGDPFRHVDGRDVDSDTLTLARPIAAVALGLALSGEALPSGTRRINLLPLEIEVQRKARRQVVGVGAGVALFALVLLALWAMRTSQVADAEDAAVNAEIRTGTLNDQIARLQDVEALQSEISARQQTVGEVLAGDVAWTRLIQEVAAVLPEDVWLTSFSGTRGEGAQPGTVTFAGMGYDHASTARWLIRLADVGAMADLWVPSSQKNEGEARDTVTFSSNATLTPGAQSDRVERYTGTPR
jgi:type IV pilus assembly protein PilM